MKHKGSITDTYIHRDNVVLPALFRKAKEVASYPTTMKELCQIAASLPVPYFCISYDAALDYIRNRLLHGRIKRFKTEYKNQLFEALYQTVLSLMEDGRRDIKKVTLLALDKPAPCVGISPVCIMNKLYDLKNKKFKVQSSKFKV